MQGIEPIRKSEWGKKKIEIHNWHTDHLFLESKACDIFYWFKEP